MPITREERLSRAGQLLEQQLSGGMLDDQPVLPPLDLPAQYRAGQSSAAPTKPLPQVAPVLQVQLPPPPTARQFDNATETTQRRIEGRILQTPQVASVVRRVPIPTMNDGEAMDQASIPDMGPLPAAFDLPAGIGTEFMASGAKGFLKGTGKVASGVAFLLRQAGTPWPELERSIGTTEDFTTKRIPEILQEFHADAGATGDFLQSLAAGTGALVGEAPAFMAGAVPEKAALSVSRAALESQSGQAMLIGLGKLSARAPALAAALVKGLSKAQRFAMAAAASADLEIKSQTAAGQAGEAATQLAGAYASGMGEGLAFEALAGLPRVVLAPLLAGYGAGEASHEGAPPAQAAGSGAALALLAAVGHNDDSFKQSFEKGAARRGAGNLRREPIDIEQQPTRPAGPPLEITSNPRGTATAINAEPSEPSAMTRPAGVGERTAGEEGTESTPAPPSNPVEALIASSASGEEIASKLGIDPALLADTIRDIESRGGGAAGTGLLEPGAALRQAIGMFVEANEIKNFRLSQESVQNVARETSTNEPTSKGGGLDEEKGQGRKEVLNPPESAAVEGAESLPATSSPAGPNAAKVFDRIKQLKKNPPAEGRGLDIAAIAIAEDHADISNEDLVAAYSDAAERQTSIDINERLAASFETKALTLALQARGPDALRAAGVPTPGSNEVQSFRDARKKKNGGTDKIAAPPSSSEQGGGDEQVPAETRHQGTIQDKKREVSGESGEPPKDESAISPTATRDLAGQTYHPNPTEVGSNSRGSINISSRETSALKGFQKSGGTNLEEFRDSVEGKSLISKINGLIERPAKSSEPVNLNMIPLGKDLKIVDGVIQSIPVAMVNDLLGGELSTKKFLHNQTVLEPLTTNAVNINADEAIASGVPRESPDVAAAGRSTHEPILTVDSSKVKEAAAAPLKSSPNNLRKAKPRASETPVAAQAPEAQNNPPSLLPPPAAPANTGEADQPEPSKEYAAKQAFTRAEMKRLTDQDLHSPERVSMMEQLKTAQATGEVERTPLRVMETLSGAAEPWSAVQTAGALAYLIDTDAELKKAAADFESAKDDAERLEATARYNRALRQYVDTLTALDRVGTEQGRALAQRRLTLNALKEQIPLPVRAEMARKAGGKTEPMDAPSRARFEAMEKETVELRKKLAELEARQRDQDMELETQRAKGGARKRPRGTANPAYDGALEDARRLIRAGCSLT